MHWQNRSFSFLLAIPQEIVITALSTFLVACNEVSFKIVLFVLRQTWFTTYSKWFLLKTKYKNAYCLALSKFASYCFDTQGTLGSSNPAFID